MFWFPCLLTVLFWPSVAFSVDVSCSKTINSCSCQTSEGKVVDLSPLSTGTAPRFSQQAIDQYTYNWDPCRAFSCGGSQVSACQVSLSGVGYVIGLKSTAYFSKDGNSIALKYTDGNFGGRASIVHLICDPTATEPQFSAKGETSPQSKNYEMTLTAKEVCPVDHGGGGGGGGGGGLSIGDVLLIIFFVSIICYLVIGIVINIFVRKQSGTDAIPNRGFWTTLPGLVKDGGKFAYTKSRQMVSKDGGSYQEM